jgi:hypothetical protein
MLIGFGYSFAFWNQRSQKSVLERRAIMLTSSWTFYKIAMSNPRIPTVDIKRGKLSKLHHTAGNPSDELMSDYHRLTLPYPWQGIGHRCCSTDSRRSSLVGLVPVSAGIWMSPTDVKAGVNAIFVTGVLLPMIASQQIEYLN